MSDSGKTNLIKGFILGLAASLLGLLATRHNLQHPALNAELRPAAPARPVVARQAPSYSWIWVVTAGASAILIGLGSLRVLEMLLRPLAIILLAVTLASALQPFVKILERRLPRAVAVISVYLVLILLL